MDDVIDSSAAGRDPRPVRCRTFVILAVLGAACHGAPSLSETGQQLVSVQPTTSDFGPLEVGMTSAARGFSVNPLGVNYSYDTVTSITHGCPDFIVDAPGLPADVYRVCEGTQIQGAKGESSPSAQPCTGPVDYQNYPFSAQFKPNVGGATSCVVTITLNSSTTKTVTLYGTGTIPPVQINVTPPSVAFGDVRRNTTSAGAQIMVKNFGGQTMTVSSVTASAGFSIASGPSSTTVASNGSQPYSVVCQPTGLGTMNGSFVVNSNDPLRPSVTVPLTCRGIDSNLDITPSPAAIPTTRVGEPVESDISLVNSGAASMTITSVALDSPDLELVSAPNAGTVLAGSGGNAPVRVRFAAGAASSAEGTLTVVYDGTETRTSQVSARALATSMALTPDGDVDLGPICIGQTKTQPFSILANAEAGFEITDVSTPEAPFSLVAPTIPATVKGSGANTITFEVRAQPLDPGPMTSSISVTTDIPAAAPRTINLSAIALGEGVAGTPEILDLGSQPLDQTTIGQEVAVSNCTMTPTMVANARIEGLDAASFAIVQQPTSATLAPNAVGKWLVVFTPRTSGVKEATFSVDHDGGTASIALIGEGLGPFGGDGPKGYYACNAGGASALWPLLIALFAIRRRSRRR